MISAKKIKEEGRKLTKGFRHYAERRLAALGREQMPTRDITGECEGECRDRVKEGEAERQRAIKAQKVETPESYPRADWAKSRNNPPGELGGHV